jgi:SAM-dependent methyltransferase
VSGQRFAYDRCERCGSLFCRRRPDDLASYYEGDYFRFDADGEAAWRQAPEWQEFEHYRLDALLRHVAPGRLIEIGAGAGAFSWFASQRGFDVTAIEMDPQCCEYLSSRLGVAAINSNDAAADLPSLQSARVIALWHVLEHLPNPAEVLDAALDRLEPDGVLALGVPNLDSLQFRLLRARWAHLDAPRHVVIPPVSALLGYASEHGLECVELTTDDPFGRHCNLFGWQQALARRPARGLPRSSEYAAAAIRRLAKPVERRALNGSAVLMMFQRAGAR